MSPCIGDLSGEEGVTKDTNPLCCACFVVSAARCCLHGGLPSSSSPPRKAGGDFSYVSDCACLSLSTDPFPFFLFLFGGRRWCCEGNGRFILQSDSFPALTRGSCMFCRRSAGVEFVSVCSWVPSVGASLKSRQHAEPKRKKRKKKTTAIKLYTLDYSVLRLTYKDRRRKSHKSLSPSPLPSFLVEKKAGARKKRFYLLIFPIFEGSFVPVFVCLLFFFSRVVS